MSITELITRGAAAINATPELITSPSRLKYIVYTRHAICTIAWDYGYKYREISTALNRKNATICNSRRRTSEMLSFNAEFRSIYNLIAASHVL